MGRWVSQRVGRFSGSVGEQDGRAVGWRLRYFCRALGRRVDGWAFYSLGVAVQE